MLYFSAQCAEMGESGFASTENIEYQSCKALQETLLQKKGSLPFLGKDPFNIFNSVLRYSFTTRSVLLEVPERIRSKYTPALRFSVFSTVSTPCKAPSRTTTPFVFTSS